MRFLAFILGLFLIVILGSYVYTRTWALPGTKGGEIGVACTKNLADIGAAVVSANVCETDADCALFGKACVPVTTCNTIITSAAVEPLNELLDEYGAACGALPCTPCPNKISMQAVCEDGTCFLETGLE
jgi:hypothetical protein